MNQNGIPDSLLKIFSLGIVTEDKPLNSNIIKVNPIEVFTLSEGLLSSIIQDESLSLPDAFGQMVKTQAESTVIIQAEWVPGDNSNRITPPDVIKNETVKIWRYANTDRYYWSTFLNEPGIRRRERVIFAFGNIQEPLVQWDETTSYWLMVDTIHKKVQLHTAKNDGEPYSYDMIIDTAKGTVSLTDSINNYLKLDSSQSDFTIHTNKTTNVISTQQVNVNTKVAVVNASVSSTINTKDATVSASNSSTVKTKTATLNAQTLTMNVSQQITANTPTFQINGNLAVSQNITAIGNLVANSGQTSMINGVFTTQTIKSTNANFTNMTSTNCNCIN